MHVIVVLEKAIVMVVALVRADFYTHKNANM